MMSLSAIRSMAGWQFFEAKRAMTLGDLESACDKALRQIDQRMYAKDFEDEYDSDHIHCYGIAFYKKRCFVKKKGLSIFSPSAYCE